jgi:hypothetical protein
VGKIAFKRFFMID